VNYAAWAVVFCVQVLLYSIIAIYYCITLFHELNGSIKICKKVSEYNTTKKRKKKKKKQELRLMFGYQPT